jgi:nuclear pore complex protein Nup205
MLSGLLYLISRLGCFAAGDVQKCGDWLHGHAQHASTCHVLTATIFALASVSPIAPSSSTATRRQELSQDPSLASSMRSLLAPTAKWAEPGLKAVLLLTWALFATDARRRSPSLE